jgi:hypothetical protein
LVHINPTLFSIAAPPERETAADKKPRLSVVSTYLFSTHASNRARLKRVTLDLKCVPVAISFPSPWWSQALKSKTRTTLRASENKIFEINPRCSRTSRLPRVIDPVFVQIQDATLATTKLSKIVRQSLSTGKRLAFCRWTEAESTLW